MSVASESTLQRLHVAEEGAAQLRAANAALAVARADVLEGHAASAGGRAAEVGVGFGVGFGFVECRGLEVWEWTARTQGTAGVPQTRESVWLVTDKGTNARGLGWRTEQEEEMVRAACDAQAGTALWLK